MIGLKSEKLSCWKSDVKSHGIVGTLDELYFALSRTNVVCVCAFKYFEEITVDKWHYMDCKKSKIQLGPFVIFSRLFLHEKALLTFWISNYKQFPTRNCLKRWDGKTQFMAKLAKESNRNKVLKSKITIAQLLLYFHC